jgi:L-fuconolactonase
MQLDLVDAHVHFWDRTHLRYPWLDAVPALAGAHTPAELALENPETSFVLDHAGKPSIARGLLDPWRADLRELGRLANVSCKLSGLVTQADPRSWTAQTLKPYADHVLESFGPERLLFGSDWPVLKLAATYQSWLEAASSLLEALAPAARHALIAGNARRIYRLA